MHFSELLIRIIDLFYLRPVRAIMPRQTFRYAVCGGVNMVLSWVGYFVAYNYVMDKEFTDLGFVVISPHIAAMLLVFPINFLVGFWLNSQVAFRRSPLATGIQLFRYALSVGGSILLNYAGLKLLVEVCGCWATPSQVFVSLIIVLYSYLVAKYFTFRNAARE
ncbi:MAG: GtrA family protein [Alistipes sp.]